MKYLFPFLVMFLSCQSKQNVVESEPEMKPSVEHKTGINPVIESNEIIATSVKEMVEAIGSKKTIRLGSGDFVLNNEFKMENDKVRYNFFGKGQLIIRNVDSLTIIGQKDTRILAFDRSATTMSFYNSSNIKLENLIIGHTLEPNVDCQEGVLIFEESQNIQINNTTLFGSGTIGLTMFAVTGFEFSNSSIRECTKHIMTLLSCKEIRFVDSYFNNNLSSEENLIGLYGNSSNIAFVKCEIKENIMTADPESGSFLYSLNSDVSNITLEGVSVENNQADYFIAGHEGQFRLQDCIITNNSFELNQ